MSIWFNNNLSIEQIKPISRGTMAEYIGIELTELGENYIKGRMPVDHRTQQPYGLLHGGASAAFAVGRPAVTCICQPIADAGFHHIRGTATQLGNVPDPRPYRRDVIQRPQPNAPHTIGDTRHRR